MSVAKRLWESVSPEKEYCQAHPLIQDSKNNKLTAENCSALAAEHARFQFVLVRTLAASLARVESPCRGMGALCDLLAWAWRGYSAGDGVRMDADSPQPSHCPGFCDDFFQELIGDQRAPTAALLCVLLPSLRLRSESGRGCEDIHWAIELLEGVLDEFNASAAVPFDVLDVLYREAMRVEAKKFDAIIRPQDPPEWPALPVLGDPTRTPVVLVVAGSDSGGGAGIQADVKALEAAGVFSTTALTALTAQNTNGVSGVHCAPATFVEAQFQAVVGDFNVRAVKTGMLPDADTIDAVARGVRESGVRNLVVDPVLVSTSGHRLVSEEALARVKDVLVPLATLVTPNVPEAAAFLGISEEEVLRDRAAAARQIGALGSQYVLLKGGHAKGEAAEDLLLEVSTGRLAAFSSPWVCTENTHGTGCTLASAIAGHLSRGLCMDDAVRAAKEYITACLRRSARGPCRLGKGRQQPMQHNQSAGWCWLAP